MELATVSESNKLFLTGNAARISVEMSSAHHTGESSLTTNFVSKSY